MHINDNDLRWDAVTRFEKQQKAKREAIAFAVAILVGSFVFTMLSIWWLGR